MKALSLFNSKASQRIVQNYSHQNSEREIATKMTQGMQKVISIKKPSLNCDIIVNLSLKAQYYKV